MAEPDQLDHPWPGRHDHLDHLRAGAAVDDLAVFEDLYEGVIDSHR
jgi:hypothetical protein